MVGQNTAADVERWVAQMRKEIAIEPPASGEIRTPDEIVFQLERVDAVASNALWTVTAADKVRAAAAEALLKARARARSGAEGKNQAERDAAVELGVEEERSAEVAAQIAYRYAKGLADLVDSRKSSLQTQAKLVLATYQMSSNPRRG